MCPENEKPEEGGRKPPLERVEKSFPSPSDLRRTGGLVSVPTERSPGLVAASLKGVRRKPQRFGPDPQ